MSFWYRFEFGFAIFRAHTKDQSKWLEAAISYFDLLANGYMASNMFLQISSSMEVLKTQPKDYKTSAAVYLAYVELRQAYLFLYWLFFQNTLDLLNIQAAVGVPVDAKVHGYYDKMVPYMQNYAFMHLDVALDIKQYNLYFDGKAYDTSKQNAAFSLWHAKKFAWTVRSLNFAKMSPDGMQMKQYMGSLAPWLGFSLSHLAYLWGYFGSLSTTPAVAAPKGAEVVLHAAAKAAKVAAPTNATSADVRR